MRSKADEMGILFRVIVRAVLSGVGRGGNCPVSACPDTVDVVVQRAVRGVSLDLVAVSDLWWVANIGDGGFVLRRKSGNSS